MAGQTKSPSKTIAGINVTPLVDVLLVLLVIFMITTKVVNNRAVTVDLPQVAAEQVADHPTVELVITAAAEATCAGKEVTLQTFQTCFTDPKSKIIIAADKKTPHGAIVEWLNALQKAEMTTISFATVAP